jgi:sulfite oxidase
VLGKLFVTADNRTPWRGEYSTCEGLISGNRNFDLHVTSSCHRVKIYSINRKRRDTAARLKQLEAIGMGITPISQPLPFDLESEEHYDEQVRLRGGRDPVE